MDAFEERRLDHAGQLPTDPSIHGCAYQLRYEPSELRSMTEPGDGGRGAWLWASDRSFGRAAGTAA